MLVLIDVIVSFSSCFPFYYIDKTCMKHYQCVWRFCQCWVTRVTDEYLYSRSGLTGHHITSFSCLRSPQYHTLGKSASLQLRSSGISSVHPLVYRVMVLPLLLQSAFLCGLVYCFPTTAYHPHSTSMTTWTVPPGYTSHANNALR